VEEKEGYLCVGWVLLGEGGIGIEDVRKNRPRRTGVYKDERRTKGGEGRGSRVSGEEVGRSQG